MMTTHPAPTVRERDVIFFILLGVLRCYHKSWLCQLILPLVFWGIATAVARAALPLDAAALDALVADVRARLTSSASSASSLSSWPL